jgi:BirA family biotin operon repressor/biotin-[acetyl-CoA-carboxylase] ligase
LPELSLVAGGAVAQAIAEITGIEPAIKFPNDLLIGMRKVAGILAESSEGRVVLGIGVNVNQTAQELPADTPTPPTSLRVVLGEPVDRARLLAAILLHLERDYDIWTTGTATSG